MLSDDACLTLSDDSASHALGYYRGVLRNSSLEPKAPALCPGLSLFSVNRRAPNRQQAPALVKWSWRPFWGCRRYDKSRPVASRGGSGRSLTAATEHTMAFKWTKASRAKLSRSQKARWKERKRQQRRKRPKRPSR